MLGKAVKFRYCPATVSALPAGFVMLAESGVFEPEPSVSFGLLL
jgi:hypothetical protein